jgi:hypothetical protein
LESDASREVRESKAVDFGHLVFEHDSDGYAVEVGLALLVKEKAAVSQQSMISPFSVASEESASAFAVREPTHALRREISVFESRSVPNQAPEPTALLVTPRAGARVAPSSAVAHL